MPDGQFQANVDLDDYLVNMEKKKLTMKISRRFHGLFMVYEN